MNCTGTTTGSSAELFVVDFTAALDPVTDAEYFAALNANRTITDTEPPIPLAQAEGEASLLIRVAKERELR